MKILKKVQYFGAEDTKGRVLTDKEKELLCEFFGETDFERFQKVVNPNTPQDEINALNKRIYCNLFAKRRRELRACCKELRIYSKKYREIMDLITELEQQKNLFNRWRLEQLNGELELLNSTIKQYHRELAINGKLILELLYLLTSLVTNNEFASLINVNSKEVERYWESHIQNGNNPTQFFVDLIFVYKIEPEDDCPIFNALFQLYMEAIENDPELKTESRKIVNQIFGDLFNNSPKSLDVSNNNDAINSTVPPLKLIK